MFNLFLVSHDEGTFIEIPDALLDAAVAILGVFLVLIIIILAVTLLSLLKGKKHKQTAAPTTSAPVLNNLKVDENDENMMAAILVASIDFYNETKKAPQVMGVRELK